MMAVEEKSGDLQSQDDSSSGEPRMSRPNFAPIQQTDVETFDRASENFDLLVVLQKKSKDPQNQQDSSSGDHECLYKDSYQSIRDILVWNKVDRLTSRQSNISITEVLLLAKIKITENQLSHLQKSLLLYSNNEWV